MVDECRFPEPDELLIPSHRECKSDQRAAQGTADTARLREAWPQPVSSKRKLASVAAYRNDMSFRTVEQHVCLVCGTQHCTADVTPVKSADGQTVTLIAQVLSANSDAKSPLHGLVQPPLQQLRDLPVDSGAFAADGQSFAMCNTCLGKIKHGKLPAWALANGLWIGPVPPELQDLTLPERLLICPVRIKIYVVKLRAVVGPGSEYRARKGQTIAFPQNTPAFFKALPAPLSSLPDALKVMRHPRLSYFLHSSFVALQVLVVSPKNPERPNDKRHMQMFRVRRSRVRGALQWLARNNPLFADIPIDDEALNCLPEDDVPDVLLDSVVQTTDEQGDDKQGSGYAAHPEEAGAAAADADMDIEEAGAIPMPPSGVIDADGGTVSLLSRVSAVTDSYRHRMRVQLGDEPVNSIRNPSFWLLGLPWLFPYGIGAPEASNRTVPLSLEQWAKRALLLPDQRFCTDPSFIFVAANLIQRKHVAQGTRFVMQTPSFQRTADAVRRVTADKVTNLRGRRGHCSQLQDRARRRTGAAHLPVW
jgi:hypothetical protein